MKTRVPVACLLGMEKTRFTKTSFIGRVLGIALKPLNPNRIDMDTLSVTRLQKTFEECAHKDKGIEFRFARDLQVLLGYTEWRNFLTIIQKAKDACKNSGQVVNDHFVGVNKMVEIGSKSEREIDDNFAKQETKYIQISAAQGSCKIFYNHI